MKTIFKIIAILVVASIVAGGIYLTVNNTSIASESSGRGEPPAMTSADGQSFQPRERPDGGGEHEASLGRGLAGIGGTLVKITVITIIVLLVQKVFSLMGNRKMNFAVQKTE
jgi:hypothetical protein